MNYINNLITDKLITLRVYHEDTDEVHYAVAYHNLAPMTQDEVAKYCATHTVCADAYVNGEFIGSTEL